jgi:regulator of replication initiation timing
VQQDAFDRETGILWNFATTVQEFAFKSIQDVLEENDQLKRENAHLKDILESNITEILKVQEEHTKELTNLQINQGHTSDSIVHLEETTLEKFSEYDENISTFAAKMEEHGDKITANTDAIIHLDANIVSLNSSMALLEKLPLGTIIAWKELDADGHPRNWVECDGRTIQLGPWAGLSTPDINKSKRFLRGGTSYEAFEIEEDAFQEHHHEHTHNYHEETRLQWGDSWGDEDAWDPRFVKAAAYDGQTKGANHGKIVAGDKVSNARIATETRPKNIKVVFLMKCWH